jgi:acyl-coenzyme A thioesterase PaaI-like protein
MNTEPADHGGRRVRARAHPRCVICSPANGRGLQLEFAEADGGGVEAWFACTPAYEGFAGMLHGGVVASLLDGAMTNCLFARGIVAVTADLKVRFRHPVAVGTPATVRAWTERSSPPRYALKADVVQEGQVRATAEGRFLEQAHLAGEAAPAAHSRTIT